MQELCLGYGGMQQMLTLNFVCLLRSKDDAEKITLT